VICTYRLSGRIRRKIHLHGHPWSEPNTCSTATTKYHSSDKSYQGKFLPVLLNSEGCPRPGNLSIPPSLLCIQRKQIHFLILRTKAHKQGFYAMPHFPALTRRVSKGTLLIYQSEFGYVVGFRFLKTSCCRFRVYLLYDGGEWAGKKRG
jgi:hypothetical protein